MGNSPDYLIRRLRGSCLRWPGVRDMKVVESLVPRKIASFRAYHVRLIRRGSEASQRAPPGATDSSPVREHWGRKRIAQPRNGAEENGKAGKRARDSSVAPFRGWVISHVVPALTHGAILFRPPGCPCCGLVPNSYVPHPWPGVSAPACLHGAAFRRLTKRIVGQGKPGRLPVSQVGRPPLRWQL